LGVPGFSGDLAGLSCEVKSEMAEYIRFYKENREFFVNSHVYLLTPFVPLKEYENYCVFQMQGEGTEESLVFVFSNGMSRRAVRQFKLCNLDAEKSYLVEQLFADKKESVTVSGKMLMQYGMETVLPENQHVRHTAALYRVTAVRNA
jgi:alpha-galactosidase